MVGVITRNGGSDGLGKLFSKAATSQRRAQIMGLLAGLMLFWDDYSSILILGSCMLPVMDACQVRDGDDDDGDASR